MTTVRIRLRRAAVAAAALTIASFVALPAKQSASGRADYHVHLSLETPASLDSLIAHGISAVRDCGGDTDSLLRWRDDIAAGKRRGPKLYIAGPLLDGPKPGATHRITITDAAAAERAVDSLARRRVDFLKVHNAVPVPAFFALLRRARMRGLQVAAHLPRGVPAWVAVDSGAGSIEHAAESLLSSPIYAGFVATGAEALAWWKSPAGDSVVRKLGRQRAVIVPTLVRYEAMINSVPDSAVRAARAAALPELISLVARLNAAGARVRAGTDMAGVAGIPSTWRALEREQELLAQAGLSAAQLKTSTDPDSLAAWIRGR